MRGWVSGSRNGGLGRGDEGAVLPADDIVYRKALDGALLLPGGNSIIAQFAAQSQLNQFAAACIELREDGEASSFQGSCPPVRPPVPHGGHAQPSPGNPPIAEKVSASAHLHGPNPTRHLDPPMVRRPTRPHASRPAHC